MKIKLINKNSPRIANEEEAKLEIEKHQTHYKSGKKPKQIRKEKVTTE